MHTAVELHGSAPCLVNGPLSEAGCEFVRAMAALGDSSAASVVRAWSVAHIFQQREGIFDSQADPIMEFAELLRRTAALADLMKDTGFSLLGQSEVREDATDIEATTGDHYSNLFRSFDGNSYWNETRQLLSVRLARNGIDLDWVKGKSVLDAGCGGGRYTGAWRLLGAKPAVGVDISQENVQDATERALAGGLDDILFLRGNVLSLPGGRAYDIVFSNGVLHHTVNWRAGVQELVRVLAPGGLGWLYLIENPGGIFWDAIEILRVVMSNESRATARRTLRLLGIPPNRVFYMLDHVMAPINLRLTVEEVKEALINSGATRVRRLERGADFDRIERIYQNEPYAREKFGAGENRFVFSRD
jgi:SAM-dependent methyltransferase